MKTDDAVEAIKAKLKEMDAQNVPVVQAYESYQADRKAVQRTLELLLKDVPKSAPANRSGQPPPLAKAATEPAAKPEAKGHVEYGGLIEAVRGFVSTMTGKFTTQDVEKFLKNQHPDLHAKLKPGALSGTFYKLRESGAIKLVDQGSGRKPSTYVKP